VRYAALVHPGDSYSYDIFSQAGGAVLDPNGPDPLGGLHIRKLIALGESQSAFRLVTYVNAIDPVARVFDGFLIHSRGGGGAPLSQAPLPKIPVSDVARIRTDVRVPVLTFQTFRDEAQAIELANSTRYGLSAIVYTGTQERAERVGRAVRAGTVWVNTFLVRDLTAPFGGVGISGIGREGGDYALDFYSDLKTLQISQGTTA
jgi:hypothetical protein